MDVLKDLYEILKTFGFPVVCALGVGYAYWKATNGRIQKLEEIVASQNAENASLQDDRLARAEIYASTMKDVAVGVSSAIRENVKAAREQHSVLKTLIDTVMSLPCRHRSGEYHPRERSLSDELPVPPEDPSSDSYRRKPT